ncbi:Ribosome small subunit-stimulated GTPase EngC [hydrothermal vent metagenome]|uniref:Ribosome small subunit-stimulated GTPase EngC n=1 Tax=hydrothermal vent metagenome TaxID=652676 RepID=A0A1W1BTB8_9ZZZZ
MQGKVLVNFGKEVLIQTQNNEKLTGFNNKKKPCVAGDNILYRVERDKAIITDRLERNSYFQHRDKTIIANLDVLILVVAINPHYEFDLINRYLIAANKYNLELRIIVNKIDLVKDFEQLFMDFITYENIGYSVDYLSQFSEDKLQIFLNSLKNKSYIFIGQSGVGKSTIINTLMPDLKLETQTLSKNNLGKHTTTITKLYPINQGFLVDSPGIREFNLENFSHQEILDGFIEFKKFKDKCKFRNCFHIDEKECGVKQAVEDGMINLKRYHSYLNLLEM